MPKAKLFSNGGSQAVRLPAEFRFEGYDVNVRRDCVTGDIVLSKPRASWDNYFAWAATLNLRADFMAARDQSTDDLRDPFGGVQTTTAKKKRA
jgi:antitoxin VapB